MCLKELAVSFLLASAHHTPGDYNETHHGLGVEVPVACTTQVLLGTYENSHFDRTLYAGASVEKPLAPGLWVGGMAALATGYPETPVLAATTVRVGTDDLSVRLLHVPDTVTAVQLRVGF